MQLYRIILNVASKPLVKHICQHSIAVLIIISATFTQAFTQQVIFEASTSAGKVGLDNQFQLTFKITNANRIEKFIVPNITDFIIVGGPMQSSSFNMVNGSTSSSRSYTYYLQPKAVGKFTIQAASASVNGEIIKCNPVTIEVVKGYVQQKQGRPNNGIINGYDPFDDPFFKDPFGKGGKPTPNSKGGKPSPNKPAPALPKGTFTYNDIKDKIFAKIDIDKTEPFVGEQITAEYNIYTQIPAEVAIKKPSSPEGFWVQDYGHNSIDPTISEKVMINGKEYRRYTLRKAALFAVKPGILTIPPTDIEGAIEDPNASAGNMQDILSQIFDMGVQRSIPISFSSTPVQVNVKPLPITDVPQEFTGSVGEYTIEGILDRSELSTDETATITYTIRGSGNIKNIAQPTVSFSGDFEVYPPKIFDTITNTDNEITGFKSFKYVLQPRTSGELFIPPATFTYFDKASNTYKSLSTTEYTLKVKPGHNAGKLSQRKNLPQDIHDIVNDDTMMKQVQQALPEQAAYWLGYLLPLLALGGIKMYTHKKQKDAQHPELQKSKNATHIAQQRLSIAAEMVHQQQQAQHQAFYNETHKALWLYLSDKLSIPLSKLTKDNVQAMLLQAQVPSTTIQQYLHLAGQCEQAVYGQAIPGLNKQDVYNEALNLITTLEDAIA
jgi:hypothetical protein